MPLSISTRVFDGEKQCVIYAKVIRVRTTEL